MEKLEKIVYISFDNNEFDTAEECIEYEKAFIFPPKIKVFDEQFSLIDTANKDFESLYNSSYYMYIPDEESREALENYGELLGYYSWSDGIKEVDEGGIFVAWDGSSTTWHRIDHIIKNANKLLSVLE